MTISVRYADWHVGDGDQAIVVGRPWRVTIELQRTSIVDSSDWWPTVEPVHDNPPTGLQQLPGEPGGYRALLAEGGDACELVRGR